MSDALRTNGMALTCYVMSVETRSIAGKNVSGAVDDIQSYGMLLMICGHESQERQMAADCGVLVALTRKLGKRALYFTGPAVWGNFQECLTRCSTRPQNDAAG